MKNKISNVAVNYEIALFDHFPLFFSLDIDLDASLVSDKEAIVKEFVNWKKMSDVDKKFISANIDDEINRLLLLDNDIFMCSKINCNDSCHKDSLNSLFAIIKLILLKSTEKFNL